MHLLSCLHLSIDCPYTHLRTLASPKSNNTRCAAVQEEFLPTASPMAETLAAVLALPRPGQAPGKLQGH